MARFKTVEVLFKDSTNNYKTSVNGQSSTAELKKYFVGSLFNVADYPGENMKKCIKIKIT